MTIGKVDPTKQRKPKRSHPWAQYNPGFLRSKNPVTPTTAKKLKPVTLLPVYKHRKAR